MDLQLNTQREYLTRSEVLAAGGNDRDIRAAKRSGEITIIRAGVYVPTPQWRQLRPAGKSRICTHAVLDRLGDGYVGTHLSAVVEHDIEAYGQDLRWTHVTHRRGGQTRRENGIVFHAGPIADDDIIEIDGRLYSKPARALWEHAMSGSIESALVSLDCGLRVRAVSRAELSEIGGVFTHWRGSRAARIAMRLCDGRSGSPGESRSRYKFYRYGIPAPELQYEVRKTNGILVARTDFAWLRQRHIGEFDGRLKYDTQTPWVEDPRSEVLKEKYREDEVREEMFGVSRWGWIDLDPPRLLPWLDGLRMKLDQSERLYGRNAVHIALS